MRTTWSDSSTPQSGVNPYGGLAATVGPRGIAGCDTLTCNGENLRVDEEIIGQEPIVRKGLGRR